MKDKIIELVYKAVKEVGEEQNKEALLTPNLETPLYGKPGYLDSLGIVFLVTELEELIAEEFDCEITLADERAMSQRTSPFRKVSTLVNYTEKLLKEENISNG
ncbi:MAG: hypothetical protein ABFS56_30095 [Pseudomonadota bacterium]